MKTLGRIIAAPFLGLVIGLLCGWWLFMDWIDPERDDSRKDHW